MVSNHFFILPIRNSVYLIFYFLISSNVYSFCEQPRMKRNKGEKKKKTYRELVLVFDLVNRDIRLKREAPSQKFLVCRQTSKTIYKSSSSSRLFILFHICIYLFFRFFFFLRITPFHYKLVSVKVYICNEASRTPCANIDTIKH